MAYVTRADCVTLIEQMGLQLGTKGSKTKISHGAKAHIKVGPVDKRYYLDVVDINRYDLILGTPFFDTYDVDLSFGKRRITIAGVDIEAYDPETEAETLRHRAQERKARVMKQLRTALLSPLENE